MKIGDLVKHCRTTNSRQLGIITKSMVVRHGTEAWTQEPKYRVYWFCMQKEEYWLTCREVKAL